MSSATPTGEGQIAIPLKAGIALGEDAGDSVPARTLPVTDLKGMFGKPRRTVSIAEMNAAIAKRGAAR
jgi:hypothetical protein